MKRHVYSIILALCILPFTAHAQWIEDAGAKATIQRGILATYNLEFKSAEKEFSKIAKQYPDHPAGRFLLGMVDWWRIIIDPDNTSNDDRMLDKLDEVIELCDRRLDKNENDIAALFFKGGSLGFRGRLYAIRKDWVETAGEGKEALPIVMHAQDLAPTNADIHLGTGIYNYYASLLPDRYPVLKPLMLFLPEGDRLKGIAFLESAAKDAEYAKYEAMYFLVQTYYKYENKPSKALSYARKLHKEFPANPVFHRYVARAYMQLGNATMAERYFGEVLELCDAGKLGYTDNMEREASYYLGYFAMQKGKYGQAIKRFVQCDRLSRPMDEGGPSGFMVMANLKLGMAHDALAQREYALKQYNKVLAMNEYDNSHSIAERYKKRPYRR